MKCWNCGKATMFPWETLGKGWHKCSTCGATHIKMPKLSAYPISVESMFKGSRDKKRKARPIPKSRRAKK